jgi:hypothetical protein
VLVAFVTLKLKMGGPVAENDVTEPLPPVDGAQIRSAPDPCEVRTYPLGPGGNTAQDPALRDNEPPRVVPSTSRRRRPSP